MRIYLKYALLATATAIVLKLIIFFIDQQHAGFGRAFVFISPLATILYLLPALIATRNKEFGGFIDGRVAAAAGVRIVAIAAVLNALFDYVYYTVINPLMLPMHRQSQILAAQQDKTMPADMLQRNIDGINNVFTPFRQTTFTIFFVIGLGLAFTFIASMAVRIKRPTQNSN